MGRKPILNTTVTFKAIHAWIVKHGVPPTLEELRHSLRVGSPRTVLRYLDLLEKEGKIERRPGARGIRLLRAADSDFASNPVPIVGECPAGPLMIAEQNIEAWVRLPKTFVRSPAEQYFLLRVRGDSMNKAMVGGDPIENSDLVLVRLQASASPGDIVVALIDGQATIKRLAIGPGYYVLKPDSSNRSHQPIVVNEDFQVQGVVRRVLKKGAQLLASDTI